MVYLVPKKHYLFSQQNLLSVAYNDQDGRLQRAIGNLIAFGQGITIHSKKQVSIPFF